MFKEGIHPKVVQEILGLASITQTLDTYGNMIPSKQHEVAALMDELMSPNEVPNRTIFAPDPNKKP
ncbi:MAG: hypothetical protein P8Y72_16635 [Anaerolineales bacterium]